MKKNANKKPVPNKKVKKTKTEGQLSGPVKIALSKHKPIFNKVPSFKLSNRDALENYNEDPYRFEYSEKDSPPYNDIPGRYDSMGADVDINDSSFNEIPEINSEVSDDTPIFEPDFLALVERLSEKIKKLSLRKGRFVEFKGLSGKYHIVVYEDTLGPYIKTTCRVSHSTGIIEISQRNIISRDYDADFIFFLLLWAHAIHRLPPYNDKITIADRYALCHYVTARRPTKSLCMQLAREASFNENITLFKIRMDQCIDILKLKADE